MKLLSSLKRKREIERERGRREGERERGRISALHQMLSPDDFIRQDIQAPRKEWLETMLCVTKLTWVPIQISIIMA